MWERPTDASDCSSLPRLETPTSNLATNGGSQHPDKRKAGGPTLADEVEHLLPTPAVNDMGAGKTVDDWDSWTEKMKAAHGNGNGHGKSLSIEAARLLPTPKATNNENRSSEWANGPNLGEAVMGTWTGASTDQPSSDGPEPWDAPLPLQLSPEPRASHA
jgi:hypothetical protein